MGRKDKLQFVVNHDSKNVSAIDPKGKEVGFISLEKYGDAAKNNEVFQMGVKPAWRRMGLMGDLHNEAEKHFGTINPSRTLTDDGFAFWKSWRPDAVKNSYRFHRDKLIGLPAPTKSGQGVISSVGDRTMIATLPNGNTSMVNPDHADQLFQSVQNASDQPLQAPIGKEGGGPVEQDGITAYHGSPHDFEQFDTSKIGTGEGAQAFGHGLYFAEHEPVARGYRDKLATETATSGSSLADAYSLDHRQHAMMDDNDLASHLDDIHRNAVQTIFDKGKTKHLFADGSALIDEGNHLRPVQKQKAHMYEVHIKAHPHHFLDWDKPLSEQSEHVQKVLSGRSIFEGDRSLGEILGRAYRNELFGGDVAQMDRAKPHEVSESLARQGIKGIKYLDAGSRGGGGNYSHNYVVFDHNDVHIKRKYEQGGRVGFADGGTGETPYEQAIRKAKQEFSYVGLRTVEKPMKGKIKNSSVWVDGSPSRKKLNGVSATNVDHPKARMMHKLSEHDQSLGTGVYYGDHTYVVGSHEAEHGEDSGELIMKNPKIIFGGNRNSILDKKEHQGGRVDFGDGGSVHDKFLPHNHPQRLQNLGEFMKDSVVKHPNGAPKVVYHNTDRVFRGKQFDTGMSEMGSHFGSPAQANDITYQKQMDEDIKSHPPHHGFPVYLNIKNPLRLQDTGNGFDTLSVVRQLGEKKLIDPQKWDQLLQAFDFMRKPEQIKAVQDHIKSLGHDGIVYLNRLEGFSRPAGKIPYHYDNHTDEQFLHHFPEAHDSYIAFDPHQIKSAIGNNGYFDPNSPRIDEHAGGRIGFDIGGAVPETPTLAGVQSFFDQANLVNQQRDAAQSQAAYQQALEAQQKKAAADAAAKAAAEAKAKEGLGGASEIVHAPSGEGGGGFGSDISGPAAEAVGQRDSNNMDTTGTTGGNWFKGGRVFRNTGGPVNVSKAEDTAGNFKKEHEKIHGIPVAIEVKKGHERVKYQPGGKIKFKAKQYADYGAILGTKDADGMNTDVMVGPHKGSDKAYIIDQQKHDSGKFDEHKVLLGFKKRKKAIKAYTKSYADRHGKERVKDVVKTDIKGLKKWLKHGNLDKPASKDALIKTALSVVSKKT